MYVVFRMVYKTSVPDSRHTAWYPLGNLVIDVILLRAIRMCLTGRVSWRGTDYGKSSRAVEPATETVSAIAARMREATSMSAGVSTVGDDVLVARNPATGDEIGHVRRDPARGGRRRSSLAPGGRRPAGRRPAGRNGGGSSIDGGGSSAATRRHGPHSISAEVGKPRLEAMGGDVLSTLDAIRWTVRHAGSALADTRIGPGWQRWLLMPAGTCRWVPYGVIGMLGTWNYPLFLNAPPIAQALAAGNAVVCKASESAPLCGAKLEESLREAGVPDGLVAVVQGGPDDRSGAGRLADRQGDVHRRHRGRPPGPEGPGERGESRPWPSSRASIRPSSCPTPRSSRPSGL